MRKIINVDEFTRQSAEGSYILYSCVESLIEYGGLNERNLLRDTLYTAYLQINEDNLHAPLPQHFITKALRKLFNSHIKDRVIDATIKLYREFLDDQGSDLLLQYCMEALEEDTTQLLLARIYFRDYKAAEMNADEQIKYCLHVINVANKLYTDSSVNLSNFILWASPNLTHLITNAERPVKRIAIWAFDWIKKRELLGPDSTKINRGFEGTLHGLLCSNFDLSTKGRICTILLRNENISISEASDINTLVLAKKMFKNWTHEKKYAKPDQILPKIVELALVDLLSSPCNYWAEEIAIPYLIQYATDPSFKKLRELFTNDIKSRCKAGLILFTTGHLCESDLEILKAEHQELDRWIISMSHHLIQPLSAIHSSGKDAYYFILVEPENKDNYVASVSSSEGAKLEDLRIIAACWGSEPTQEIKNLLKKQYGFFI